MTECLIVEATPAQHHRFAELLVPYHLSLAACDTAQAALHHCRRRAPAVLLLPQTLKTMPVVDFLRSLRRQSATRSPVVLLVGETGDAGDIGRAIWEGAAECLMTPFDPDILDFKLRQAGVV